jgi:hypothetical protein
MRISEQQQPANVGPSPYWFPRRPNRVRYCLPGYLAPMSAAEGEAAKTAEKRTSTTLTAGIRPVADVARNWLRRPGIANCGHPGTTLPMDSATLLR